MRIVFAGFQHETNTFAPAPADYHAFELGGGWPGLTRGHAVFATIAGSNIPAAGFIEAATPYGHQLIPSVWCAASPSAAVTREAYERIVGMILEDIAAALPVDAVYLDLHGAMVAEHADDGEGELLQRVRALIGPDTLLVSSYDLHANTTQTMLQTADVLVAYRTYPHVDMAETGRRTFAILQRLFEGMARPFTASRRIPFLLPTVWQCTDLMPAKALYARLAELEHDPEIVHVSFTMGFPAADFPECGPVVWAHGRTQQAAQRAVDALAQAVIDAEPTFKGELPDARTAVARAIAIHADQGGPVVIADTQDNPGAGCQSDTTGILRELIAQGAQGAAIGLIVDPA